MWPQSAPQVMGPNIYLTLYTLMQMWNTTKYKKIKGKIQKQIQGKIKNSQFKALFWYKQNHIRMWPLFTCLGCLHILKDE